MHMHLASHWCCRLLTNFCNACSNPNLLDCIYKSGCSYNSTWTPVHKSVFSTPSKEMCCCLCKGRPGYHHSYLARCVASVFFASSTGGNGSCHLHFAADIAVGCIPDAGAVSCLSPANLANHSQFGPTGPVCPANPKPSNPPLPCTIEPLPPAPAPANPRWASYWASVPKFLNGTNADAVTKLIALLKANGGTATFTSLIIGCGDMIDGNGSFIAGDSEGCAALIPELNAMGIGAELVLGASAVGLRAAFKNSTPVIAAMVARAKTQKLRGWGSDWEYGGTIADGQGVTCFQAKLRAALRPVGTRLTMFTDDFDGFIDDLPDLQRSVDRLLEGDTYWCTSATLHLSAPLLCGSPSYWIESNTVATAARCRLLAPWPPHSQRDQRAEFYLVDEPGVQARCERGDRSPEGRDRADRRHGRRDLELRGNFDGDAIRAGSQGQRPGG